MDSYSYVSFSSSSNSSNNKNKTLPSYHSSLHGVRKLPSKPMTKLPIAPLPPTPPKIYRVEPINFKEVVQMLTAAPEFQSISNNFVSSFGFGSGSISGSGFISGSDFDSGFISGSGFGSGFISGSDFDSGSISGSGFGSGSISGSDFDSGSISGSGFGSGSISGSGSFNARRLQDVAPPPLDLSPVSLQRNNDNNNNIAAQWREFLRPSSSSSKNQLVESIEACIDLTTNEAQEKSHVTPRIPSENYFGSCSPLANFPLSPASFAWCSSILFSPGTLTSPSAVQII